MEREQIEKMTREYNVLQEQIQSLALQREQFAERKEEYKEALIEVEKSSGKLYLAVGGVIVEVDKAYATKSMKEKEEIADMRMSIIKKQHDELSKKEQALRTELNSALKDMK